MERWISLHVNQFWWSRCWIWHTSVACRSAVEIDGRLGDDKQKIKRCFPLHPKYSCNFCFSYLYCYFHCLSFSHSYAYPHPTKFTFWHYISTPDMPQWWSPLQIPLRNSNTVLSETEIESIKFFSNHTTVICDSIWKMYQPAITASHRKDTKLPMRLTVSGLTPYLIAEFLSELSGNILSSSCEQ